ncbi:hypothetical protein Tco_1194765 [Tanacetum coccineum]
MENFLFGKNNIEFIDETIEKPEKTYANYMARMRCDAMIKGWLTTTMDKEIQGSVKYANLVRKCGQISKKGLARKAHPMGDKFEIRGRPGVFIGYPSGTKGYKIYDPSHDKIVISRDVKFAEKMFPYATIDKRDKHEEDIFTYRQSEKLHLDDDVHSSRQSEVYKENLGPQNLANHLEQIEIDELNSVSPTHQEIILESPHSLEENGPND